MLRAIYFDYHGVLDRRTFGGLLRVLEQGGVPADQRSKLESLGESYATGGLSPREWWQQVEQLGGPAAAAIGKKYILHVDPIRTMWELINTLHHRFAIGLLSDCPSDKKDIIVRAYDLPEFFEYLIFSCDVGLSKQDSTFFRLMDQQGLYRPSDILYIDDSERHVATAAALGYAAHHYSDAESLKHYILGL